MAWISVHTGIDGPKLRDLRKKLKCSKFEATGILVYLWFWGLENAEKDGRILYADKEDIEECLCGAGAGCKISASVIVESLVETGWIDEVEDGGFYIHDWEEWQEQWYKAKERRENDALRKRKKLRMQPSTGAYQQEIHPVDQDESPSQKAEAPQANEGVTPEDPKVTKYCTGFDTFWKAYPRKIGKGEAYKKYQTRRKDGYSDQELLIAAENYALEVKRKHTEQEYIKHAKTFLADSLPFLDYIPKQEQPMFLTTQNDDNPFAEYGGYSGG